MRLQIASDLHLEFPENKYYLEDNPLQVSGDVLILAGDIMKLKSMDRHSDFFSFVSDNYRQTYWIPGNHEYYDFDIANRTGQFEEAIRSNVTLLNNTTAELGGLRFHFTTLWSHIAQSAALQIERGMNDFHLIRDEGSRLSVEQYNAMHISAMDFLTDAILDQPADPSENIKNIVVTHHVPTFRHYPQQYIGSPLNQAFASDLDRFIELSIADYWIYGHHHAATADFTIGNTTLITNQLGYVHANEHKSFNPSKIIELP